MKLQILATCLVLATSAVLAQESAGFRQNEHVLNAGGRPQGGSIATSAGFRITLDSVGDGFFPQPQTGASFQVVGGFLPAYPPPDEVTGLVFTASDTLTWDPEPSVGAYNLYRGTLDSLAALTFGDCEQETLPDTVAIDADPVAPGQGLRARGKNGPTRRPVLDPLRSLPPGPPDAVLYRLASLIAFTAARSCAARSAMAR